MIDKSKIAIAIPVNETIRAVWDSGLYRSDVVGAGIYWVDNDTILVGANRGPKPRTSEEKRNEENWLYLWNLEKNLSLTGLIRMQPHGLTAPLVAKLPIIWKSRT